MVNEDIIYYLHALTYTNMFLRNKNNFAQAMIRAVIFFYLIAKESLAFLTEMRLA